MPKKVKKRKKRSLIHKLPRSISGKSKKPRNLTFLAGILVAVCTYTFFVSFNTRNSASIENERQKTVMDEYHYVQSLTKPTPNPTIPPATFHLKVPIIMYHYVEYVKDPRDTMRETLNIKPDIFETQLKTINKEGYTSYFVKDVAAALNGYKKLEDKSIVLTFDDGYEDFYTYAFPLLKKYGVKATYYVINNLVGTKGYVTEKELKEIVNSGLVEVGAHTLDHTYLKGMSKQAQEKEIIESKVGLEEMLGIRISTFAYPFGAFDDNAIEVVKEASFSAAVSVIPGNVHSINEKYYLYRIRAGGFQGPHMMENIERDFEDQ
jgi:peptidoglycan/xylan/chitin deacetylase (PgdA/CDA1 family)